MCGNLRLYENLAQLFNLFLKHGYLPGDFMQCAIIPIVKNKAGNLTDVNNYRAIALSNSITKILECILCDNLVVEHLVDAHQFGFSAGLSTTMCTHVLETTIRYYNDKGSDVFACFIDFSKAFDKVNYWKLFNKLLDDNVNIFVARLLAYWFSNQEICVSWGSVLLDSFKMNNGTRQGSLISPYLFACYIRDLVQCIRESGKGCCIAGVFIYILCYADDIVLLAPSWPALQSLLSCLDEQIQLIDMCCNTKKTYCMVFKCARKSHHVSDAYPNFIVSGATL